MLVDSGASGQNFDKELHPGLKDKLLNHKEISQDFHRRTTRSTRNGRRHGLGNGDKHRVDLPGLVVPRLEHYLFSASQAAKTELATISRPRLEKGQLVLPLQQLDMNQGIFSSDLSFVLTPPSSESSRKTTAPCALQVPTDLWHRRMRDVNSQRLRVLRDSSDNIINFIESISPCDVCAFGKSKQERHPETTTHNTVRSFQLLSADRLVPVSPPALGGFVTSASSLTNAVSGRKPSSSRRRPMRLTHSSNSSQPSESREVCASSVCALTGEANSRRVNFEKYCLDTGITHEFAVMNIAQQNRVSGRDGWTIANIARCLLKDSGFPKPLRGEMTFTATYLANRTPHSALQTQAPFIGAKLNHLQPIGSRPFAHVETNTIKLDGKAWKGRLCGYCMSSKV